MENFRNILEELEFQILKRLPPKFAYRYLYNKYQRKNIWPHGHYSFQEAQKLLAENPTMRAIYPKFLPIPKNSIVSEE